MASVIKNYKVRPNYDTEINCTKLVIQEGHKYNFTLHVACGLCNEKIEVEVATRENFSKDFKCTDKECKQPGYFRMAYNPPDKVYDYFKIEGNFEISNSVAEVSDDLLFLTGTLHVPKGATFTVIPDDNGDFTMDDDKVSSMSALSDVHGWEPAEVTGVWLEIVEMTN